MYVPIPIPWLADRRRQRRYLKLVESHLSPADQLAAGIRAVPGVTEPLSATQAAYRFFNNEHIGLRELGEPLIEAARTAVESDCDQYALVVHDWSPLEYRRHDRKQDRLASPVREGGKEGYKLYSTLLVSDRGQPLAPLALSLQAADGVHCSRSAEVRPPLSVLDELAPAMQFVARQKFAKPLVHVIDAEADSVAHYREWSAAGWQYLVRGNDRLVEYEGCQLKCSAVAERLHKQDAFAYARQVQYRKQPAEQWVGEAQVRLTRPGQQNRPGKSQARVPGPPLDLRLIVAEVRSPEGETLAVWRLLTNVPATVDAATIALWYYWRWNIESYFKLLKSAGHHVEQWEQQTAAAIARRLLVASMACVVVWHLARAQGTEAEQARTVLVKLSGRQMAYGKRFTEPALLAGLWILLAMLQTLETYSLDDLRAIAALVLPHARAGPR